MSLENNLLATYWLRHDFSYNALFFYLPQYKKPSSAFVQNRLYRSPNLKFLGNVSDEEVLVF